MIRYYYAGAARIAMRTGTAAPQYILSDHLGSTSVTTSSEGVYQSETLYKPCPFRVLREGETRWTSGTLPTKYTYTGQYSNVADFGLMYYNARWYDPLTSRFSQADTLIPNPGDPQSWDRYAYVNNSPMNFCDPSGHYKCKFQNAQAKKDFEATGWESCEEFLDWTFGKLNEITDSDVQAMMKEFYELDAIDPVTFILGGGGEPNGANLFFARKVKLPAHGVVNKSDTSSSSPKYQDALAYVTIVGHEMFHTMELPFLAGTFQGELQAYTMQYKMGVSLGLGWEKPENASWLRPKIYMDNPDQLRTDIINSYRVSAIPGIGYPIASVMAEPPQSIVSMLSFLERRIQRRENIR